MPWCMPESRSMFWGSTCLRGFTCSLLGCQAKAGGLLTALPLLHHAKVEPPLTALVSGAKARSRV